ncbi:MAG: DUF429 domain-containing protein [Candidatus Brocadiia bacterium]
MKEARWICGLDLSGPANPGHTVLAWFSSEDEHLTYRSALCPAGDADIVKKVEELAGSGPVAVGIDAPLSYRDGGGMRPCDQKLAEALKEAKMNFVGVMAPTMVQMVYITLRGIGLARTLGLVTHGGVRTVEVHPGAVMALGGASRAALKQYKKSEKPLPELRDWLSEQGLHELPPDSFGTSHRIDAAAAALGVWKWLLGESVWLAAAQPPQRPYDFAC